MLPVQDRSKNTMKVVIRLFVLVGLFAMETWAVDGNLGSYEYYPYSADEDIVDDSAYTSELGSDTDDLRNNHMVDAREDASAMESDEKSRRKNERPDIFTVETCFVTSPNYTSSFGTREELVGYLAAMLNSVALRFEGMTMPKVLFQLNQVITNMSDITIRVNDSVDINATSENMKLKSIEGAFNLCDIVVFLTNEDLELIENATIGRDVDGMAFIGGVCGEERVAVAEDTPHTYDGVHRIAHEIAHLLGASHDNESALAKFPGYPGSECCPQEKGYLMSYYDVNRNKYRLSNCSKEQIRFIYRNLSQSCTDVCHIPLHTSDMYPGHNMTRKYFCKLMHSSESSVRPKNKRSKRLTWCRMQCCWEDSDYGLSCRTHRMLDGLRCSRGKTCRLGVCAKHNWNNTIAQSEDPINTNVPLILPNKAV